MSKNKKKERKTGVTFLKAMALLLTSYVWILLSSITAMATNKTADEAINWARSQVGHSVGYNDGSGYYQCVEFIQAYYQWLGESKPRGNGYDYATNALPSGWTRIAGGTPQKGDILVYSRYSAYVQQYGHVAIYESDNCLYDQDGSVKGATVKRVNKNYRTYTYNYWGCIRPNFKTAAPSVSFSSWDNANYTYIRETDASIGDRVDVANGTCTEVGMYLYDANGKQLGKAHDAYSTRWYYYKINAELGVTLTPGTTYQYKFYAVVNGQTYWDSLKSFKTSGTAVKYYSLDLNGYLDGRSVSNINGYGTVDVYINGTLAANDCTDFYASYPAGTKYEIKDIKAVSGYQCTGIKPGAAVTLTMISGTIGNSNTIVTLSFSKKAASSSTSTTTTTTTITTIQAPTNINASNESNGIRVAWTKSSSAKGYYVYRRSGKDSWKKVATVTATTYLDKSVKNGTTYYYTVQAYSGNTKSSYDKTGKAAYRLTSIKTRSAKYKKPSKIAVKWYYNKKATGYQIQYSTKKNFSNAKTLTVKGAGKTSYTISKLAKNAKYYVRVRPYYSKGSLRSYAQWSLTRTVKVKK